jgi:acyl-CoA reductase-like NAD-dependent aldehyde dehydrogenase
MRGILYVLSILYGHSTESVRSQNAGQNCIGIERLLVPRRQYDDVFHLIIERAGHLRIGGALSADDVGAGVDVGSMISRDRFQTLQDIIDDAASRGARVGLGGGPRVHPYLTQGAFFEPTVIGEVHRDMDIAKHEREFVLHFGPTYMLRLFRL